MFAIFIELRETMKKNSFYKMKSKLCNKKFYHYLNTEKSSEK